MHERWPVARPISEAPTHDPERRLILYCPEQEAWQAGVFVAGQWLDAATLSLELKPTHWVPVLEPAPGTYGRSHSNGTTALLNAVQWPLACYARAAKR